MLSHPTQTRSMKPEEIKQLNQIGQHLIRCAIGTTLVEIPSEIVGSINLAQKSAPLPLAYPKLEGIVISEQGACLQLNLEELEPSYSAKGKYSISLNTSKGLICLRVDTVNTSSGHSYANDFSKIIGIKEIEECVKDCRLSGYDLRSNILLTEEENIGRSLLLCKSNNKTIGLEAIHVSHIEKSFKSHSVDKGVTYEKIVELEDGSLHRGISLKGWIDPNNLINQSTETWAIGIKFESIEFLLLAEDLISLTDFNEDDFYRINQKEKASCWLTHPELGPIEILNPNDFLGVKDAILSDHQNKTSAPKSNPLHTSHTASSQTGIGIHCDNFDLVIPNACIESVGQVIDPANLSAKCIRKSMPAYDLSRFFKLPDQVGQSQKRLITLNRKRKVALLVPEFYKPIADKSWQAVTSLPYPLDLFVKGVCITDGRAEFLIDESFIDKFSGPEFEKEIKNCFCGWLPQ